MLILAASEFGNSEERGLLRSSPASERRNYLNRRSATYGSDNSEPRQAPRPAGFPLSKGGRGDSQHPGRHHTKHGSRTNCPT